MKEDGAAAVAAAAARYVRSHRVYSILFLYRPIYHFYYYLFNTPKCCVCGLAENEGSDENKEFEKERIAIRGKGKNARKQR